MVFCLVKTLIEKVIKSLSGIICFRCKIFVKIVNPPFSPVFRGIFLSSTFSARVQAVLRGESAQCGFGGSVTGYIR